MGVYVKSLRSNDNAVGVVFSLYFDGVLIDKFTNTVYTNNIYQLLSSSTSYRVTGGNTHTIKLRVQHSGGSGAVFVADDFFINPTTGPNDVPFCQPVVIAPNCLAAQKTNYIKNPGFDHDDALDTAMAYWSVYNDPGFSRNSWVWDYAGYPSGNGFLGYTVQGDEGKVDSKLYLSQTDIMVPNGAVIDLYAMINPQRSGNTEEMPFTITLKWDGQVVRTLAPTGTGWVRFGTTDPADNSKVMVSGDGPHTVLLEVRTAGLEYTDIFFADNFVVNVLSGPGGQRICGV
ncbi:hypothetical protein IQ07DRAFT_647869 [Pyrenochaeta sp. DS3sAY3a]|nr:hypothetical protein IQ07DRAFT_647869 [Pyrenochaeta sp. DS3sAY3a]